MKPLKPTDALAAVVGDKPLSRPEAIKKIWAYIKRKGLQNPKNKRNILADEKLAPLFRGKKEVSMFDLAKIVNNNLK
jgi:chromatin remodeling complex protein RSC6